MPEAGVTRAKNDKKLDVMFLLCDEVAESTQKSHGGMDDLLHHLIEPLLKKADPDIELVVEGYDVGKLSFRFVF